MAQIEFQSSYDAFTITGDVTTLTCGSYVPTTVIDTSKDWHVVVNWTTSGANCPVIAGNWEIEAKLEQIGPENNLQSQSLQLTPGPSPIKYEASLKFPAYSIKAGAYRLIVLISYFDSTGKLGPIAGFSDSPLLQLFQGDISPIELPDKELSLRAEKIKVLNLLESSPSPWHTIDGISHETGFSVEKVRKLLRILDKQMMKESAPNSSGSVRYATKARIQRELRAKSQDLDIHTAAQNAISIGGSISSDSEQAYERIVGSTASVRDQLEKNYQQAREQATGQYRLALFAGGVGIVLIVIAVVALIQGQTSMAIATTVPSIVFDAMAVFFFQQSKESSQRVDKITTKLNETRDLYNLVSIVDTITDPTDRNNLKSDIVKKALSDKTKAG